MNSRNKKVFALLLTLLLVAGILPLAAPAAEGITCTVTRDGGNVTITGEAFPDSPVSLVVTRTIDGSRSYLDQADTGADGAYSFSFALDGGNYRITVSCNGLHRQSDIQIKTSDTKSVTVRVEGAAETKLPQTEIAILAGETTLFQAIVNALDSGHVQYEVANGLIHAIGGEEGWQWLINNVGGMHLPSTVLNGGEEIVLVDDLVWNPTITRLRVSPTGVKVGESFTATLEKLNGTSAAPAPGQSVAFGGEARSTDGAGKAVFTAKNQGSFGVTCEPAAPGLIRPVPVTISVTGGGGTTPVPVPDPAGRDITVQMRIEGYRGTIMDGSVSFNPEDYKGGDGKYRFTGPGGTEYVNDRATVLLATVMAWNQNGIRDNNVKHGDNYVARMAGEEEFDFESGHPTCGWLVRVNNNLINQGVGAWPVKDGDRIEWYYGDTDSYFGNIEVSPTSLKTGEKIKVKVTGQYNGGMSMSNTSGREPMEGATVYVGSEQYTTGGDGMAEITVNNPGTFEVYAIKLDKDSVSGGHYFPLMSRTVKVKITVTGPSIMTVVPVPEDPADAAKIIEEVLGNKDADAILVAETVKSAGLSLANGLEQVSTPAEASELLNSTAAVTGLLGQAAGRVTGDQAAATFGDACLQITGVLADLAPEITGDQGKATLAQSAVEAVNAAAAVLNGITEPGKMAEIAGGLLDQGLEILKHLEGQQAQAVKESLIAMAGQALARLDGRTPPESALQMEGDTLKAVIDPAMVQGQNQPTAEAAAQIIQKLAQLGVEQNLTRHRGLVINIPARGENAVSVTLSAGTMAAVTTGNLTINTSAAGFNLGPDTFGPGAAGQDIVLTAARVDSAGLPAGTNIPPGSVVVNLGASVGGQPVTGFNTPVQVSIPYAGNATSPATVTVFLLKDDGALEPVGGLYNPVTGMVTCFTDHFSKYLAKESIKKFTDLGRHEWAKSSVETLAGKGIIGGKGEGIFAPGDQVTRAEFAALLTRMLKYRAGENAALPFDDVKQGKWYHSDVAAAYAKGLISGRSATAFDPEGGITRQEMACIMAKVLEQNGRQTADARQLDQFTDRGDIADWAAPAAAMVVRDGIVGSVGEDKFAPLDKATRVQVAVMLYRLYGQLLGPGV